MHPYDDNPHGALSFRDRCHRTCIVIAKEEMTCEISFSEPFVLEQRDGQSACILSIAGRAFTLPVTCDEFWGRYQAYLDQKRAEAEARHMGTM